MTGGAIVWEVRTLLVLSRWAGLWAIITACDSGVQFDKWPGDEDAQARIAVLTDAQGLVVELRALGPTDRLEVSASGGGAGLRIELLTYTQSLAELGLTAGVLDASAGCARGCALVAPAQSFSAALEFTGEPLAWQPGDASDRVLETLVTDHVIRCDRCALYAAEVVHLPPDVADITTAFFANGDPWTYVGLDFGDLFRLDASLRVERVCRAFAGYKLRGAVRFEESLWVQDRFSIHHLDLSAQQPDESCVISTSTAPPTLDTQLDHLAGSADPQNFELYVLDFGGGLHRFDGSNWSLTERLELGSDPRTDLLWLEPGRLSVTPGDDRVQLVGGPSAQVHRVPMAGAAIRAQAFDTTLGHVFLLREGGLAFLKEGRWRLEGRDRAELLNGRAVVPEDGGVLYSAAVGTFGRWYPETGYCPLQDGLSPELVQRFGRVGPHVLFDDVSQNATFGPAVGAVSRARSRCDVP